MWRITLLILVASTTAFAQGALPPPCAATADNDEHAPNNVDYSVITEDLPALRARWKMRESVGYRGVVPVALNARGGSLFVTFVEPMTGSDPGAVQDFLVFEHAESPPWGNTFSPLWQERKTGRSLGPIHAAIRVRPRSDSSRQERRQVVVYNPPGRPDILLVASKFVDDEVWTPLLRIDMPKATRFSVMQTGWH